MLAATNTALLCATIAEQLAELRQMTGQAPYAPIQAKLARLDDLFQSLEKVLDDGAYELADTAESLAGLLMLLRHAEEMPLPAHRLAGLLQPMQQRMTQTSLNVGQVL